MLSSGQTFYPFDIGCLLLKKYLLQIFSEESWQELSYFIMEQDVDQLTIIFAQSYNHS